MMSTLRAMTFGVITVLGVGRRECTTDDSTDVASSYKRVEDGSSGGGGRRGLDPHLASRTRNKVGDICVEG